MLVRRFSGRRFGLRLLSLLRDWIVRQLLPLRRELQPRRLDGVVPHPFGLASAFLSFFAVLVRAMAWHSSAVVGLGWLALHIRRSMLRPAKRRTPGGHAEASGLRRRLASGIRLGNV
jgi:hypothetical protein